MALLGLGKGRTSGRMQASQQTVLAVQWHSSPERRAAQESMARRRMARPTYVLQGSWCSTAARWAVWQYSLPTRPSSPSCAAPSGRQVSREAGHPFVSSLFAAFTWGGGRDGVRRCCLEHKRAATEALEPWSAFSHAPHASGAQTLSLRRPPRPGRWRALQRGGGAAAEAGVEFATVDGYQGREADVVIFSCVRWAVWRVLFLRQICATVVR